jgi:hypothetical protein
MFLHALRLRRPAAAAAAAAADGAAAGPAALGAADAAGAAAAALGAARRAAARAEALPCALAATGGGGAERALAFGLLLHEPAPPGLPPFPFWLGGADGGGEDDGPLMVGGRGRPPRGHRRCRSRPPDGASRLAAPERRAAGRLGDALAAPPPNPYSMKPRRRRSRPRAATPGVVRRGGARGAVPAAAARPGGIPSSTAVPLHPAKGAARGAGRGRGWAGAAAAAAAAEGGGASMALGTLRRAFFWGLPLP